MAVDTSDTSNSIPITRDETAAFNAFAFHNIPNPPAVAKLRRITSTMISRGVTGGYPAIVALTVVETVQVHDWLDTFADLPDAVMSFKMTLFSILA